MPVKCIFFGIISLGVLQGQASEGIQSVHWALPHTQLDALSPLALRLLLAYAALWQLGARSFVLCLPRAGLLERFDEPRVHYTSLYQLLYQDNLKLHLRLRRRFTIDGEPHLQQVAVGRIVRYL